MIAESIKLNEGRSLNAEQKENFLKTFDELDKVMEDPNNEQDFTKRLVRKTILRLPYEYKKEMIETIIQNICLEKGIQPPSDFLFLPEIK